MSVSKSTPYTKLFDLSGRTAIVTGGAGILGREFCAGLAAYGANVALIDLTSELAERAASEIGAAVKGFACNVSDPDSVTRMLSAVVEEFGEIHVLHNNAATKADDLKSFLAPFDEYSLETWRKVMSVNLDGMFLVAQAVGRQMVKQGKGGSIIQTGSIYGVVAPDSRIYRNSEYRGVEISTPGVYAASKAGVLGLTMYLATLWARHNIRVNTLIPGGVESGQNQEFQDRYSERVPLGRMGDVSDMVGALLYLASDASRYVSPPKSASE